MEDEDELPAWDDTEYDVASFEVPVDVCVRLAVHQQHYQGSGVLSPTSIVPEQAMTPAPPSTPSIISPHQLGMMYLDHVQKCSTPKGPLQSNCATQGPVNDTDSEQRRGVGHSPISRRRGGKVYEQIPYEKRMGAGGGPCAECGVWQPEEIYEKEHFWDHDGVNRKKINTSNEDDGSKDDAVAAAENVNATAPIADPVFYCEDCWEEFDEMDDDDNNGGKDGGEGERSGARRKHSPASSSDIDSSDDEDPETKIINLDKPFQNIDGTVYLFYIRAFLSRTEQDHT